MLLALTAAAAAHALAPPASPLLVVDRFHAALDKGDAKAALGLLAEDALIFESGEVERSKAEYRAKHLDADMEFSQAVTERVGKRTVRAAGNLAWVASEGRTSGSFRGRDVDRATTETMVLRRMPAGWRIVHIHWSSAAH